VYARRTKVTHGHDSSVGSRWHADSRCVVRCGALTVEGLLAGDIIDERDTVRTAVVVVSDRTEALLTGRILITEKQASTRNRVHASVRDAGEDIDGGTAC
jgi:hypothetical protein